MNLTKDQASATLDRLKATEVKGKLSKCLNETGSIRFTNHALERMKERKIESLDVTNVLRAGKVPRDPEEFDGRNWRYSIATPKFKIVFCFHESTVIVITAIRKDP